MHSKLISLLTPITLPLCSPGVSISDLPKWAITGHLYTAKIHVPYKAVFLIFILCCFGPVSLPAEDTDHKSMAIGHDQYKKKAIQNAEASKEALQAKYAELVTYIKEHPLTGDEAHDRNFMETIKQNQKDWMAYQYSYCHTQALAEVYPHTSRLFVQTLNSCLSELNDERLQYLNNLLEEISQ